MRTTVRFSLKARQLSRFERFSGGGTWTFRDNAFHDTGLTNVNASVVNDHNAYIGTGQYGIGGSGGGDVVTNLFTYTSSYLGNFYHLSTSLIDRGSRSASAAGLYHYTVRADQTKETNSIVDIGFHYVVTDATGNPMDSDGDSLPDYFEDKNGNGSWDNDETNWQDPDTDDDGLDDGQEMSLGTDPTDPDTDHDGVIDGMEQQHDQNPLNPDTDQDGWPDGAELAEELLLFLYSYQLNASRDFITVPRSPALPDAVVTMNWSYDQASTMDVTGDMSECYEDPQPEDAKSDGTEYRWPGSGSGTSQYWKITFGNPAKQYGSPEQSDRPPSQQIDIPWERCSNLNRTNSTTNSSFYGSFSRSALATVHVKSDAPTWPKPKRSVVLSCQASDMSGDPDLPTLLSVTAFSSGSRMGEPNTSPGGIDIARTNIVVDGRRASPSGEVLVQVDKVGEKDVTPTVENVTWFRYSLSKAEPKPVLLTWSYHPGISNTVPDLQAAFDEGAKLLASDDDGQGDGGVSDDVSCYLEFFILEARKATFPFPYNATEYNIVTNWDKLNTLARAGFANVKVVSGISIRRGTNNIPLLGYGYPCSQVGMVISAGAATNQLPLVAIHEYGHTIGVLHRGETNVIHSCEQSNPGDPDDATAIMHREASGGREINLNELQKFDKPFTNFWNE